VIRNWRKYLTKIKCVLNEHKWEYTGEDILTSSYYIINKRGFFRFCPNCGKKQERHIFDFGRLICWSNVKELTPEEQRVLNLNKLGI
jgi:hypothetical protein